MTAAVSPARWPEVVWDAAVLRGIDARARAEIEAAGRLRTMKRDEVVYRPGEPADALYVVVEGACVLAAIRRGEADASVIRRAGRGEVFGEEATVVAFGVRQMEARCEEPSVVAEVPLTVLRRAIGRSGGGELATRLERALKRAATVDLLRTTSFTRALPERDIEVLLDAVRHVAVARGEHVYREGDTAASAYLVADGLLQAQSDDGGKPRVEAYLSRGDLFGDDELEERSVRRVAVVASGPTWLVAIPREVFLVVARRNASLLDGVRRVRVDGVPPQLLGGGTRTTAHVFQDLYRMRVARSLLVIDQDSCVRCGHCAWSCASTHDDGISRLVRRGDKVVVQREEPARPGEDVVARVVRLAKEVEWAPLLVPNSCQHCKNPSCMIDCPTGAIGRDARGEVFIREDLCTGCGSCAKACPWDNIQIAPRSETKGAKNAYPDVAVKCDLCAGSAAGPACVASCPTQAIARIDPNEALVELRSRSRETRTGTSPSSTALGVFPQRIAAWPSAVGAAFAGGGLALASLSPMASGAISGAIVALLVAYSGLKRSPRVLARIRGAARLGRTLYVAHLALGIVALGATFAHTHGAAPGNVAGALALAMSLALATGLLGAALHVVLPARLARLERGSVLPEELVHRRREVDERIFTQLSGRSELVKTLYGRVLRPYRAARFGALALVVSGRRLRDEEKRVRAVLGRLLEGRKSEKLDGLDDLVRLVVEHRAIGALRGLTIALRGWLPVHLAATAAAVVLLIAHVVAVMVRR
ncbi:MAG: Formate dehydrogenase beta subunit [Labilithrix sp.]|nr:Formate dehydrogenase beta subunit [Labilithrix sp.]